jgi:RimJ/RimL family protein N-acetyltransferase
VSDLSSPPPLSDGVVRLRPWCEEDLDCVQAASRDPRIREGTTVPAECTREQGLAFIARQHARLGSGQGISLAITEEATDHAVGLVVLMLRPQQRVAGIGYWVIPTARRRGMGSRAVALMTAWGLGAGGFVRVEAWVEPGNTASTRLLEANGYLFEGRLRSFLTFDERRADALTYSRIHTEDGPGPDAPP